MAKHTCPRRHENGMHLSNGPFRGGGENLDEYKPQHGLVSQARGCSYCGSMPPDDFMVMVREGGVVGPTDKSYKLYIGKALTEDEKVARKQRWLETDAMARAIRDLGAQDGKTQEQIDADLEKMWAENNDLHLQSSSEGKFYTVHLSPEQGWEFYSLWQDKKVVWGYPGYPYRRLYLPGPSDAPPSTTTQEPGGSHVEA